MKKKGTEGFLIKVIFVTIVEKEEELLLVIC